MKRNIFTLRAGLLTCCAVGVLMAANPSYAALVADTDTITNCAEVSETTETDKDSLPGGELDGVTNPTDEDDHDCAVITLNKYDYSDAPDDYNTSNASGSAAYHQIYTGLQLGAVIDDEIDGFPSVDADGDDTNPTDGVDDEDSISFGNLVDGATLSREVVVTNEGDNDATLVCWVDFDGSMTFDADEAATATVAAGTSGGTVTLTWAGGVPATTSSDVQTATGNDFTYARCRLSTDVDLSADTPDGFMDDGEIEDYKVALTPVYDLALDKKLGTGQGESVNVGDDVTFTITVYNQGSIGVDEITITDYIPEGFTLKSTDWATVDADGNTTYTITDPLAAGASTTVDIILTVDSDTAGQTLTNTAEISEFKDADGTVLTDEDSTPDNINDDDTTDNPLVDDEINGDAKDTTATDDEDDHDIAEVTVKQVDVTLSKTAEDADGTTVTSVRRGDTVFYELTVINEGPDDATGVAIEDALPSGVTYVSSAGEGSYDNTTSVWTVGDLLVSDTDGKTIRIEVTVD